MMELFYQKGSRLKAVFNQLMFLCSWGDGSASEEYRIVTPLSNIQLVSFET